jgi:DNA-binding transcriptional LysR family regulator
MVSGAPDCSSGLDAPLRGREEWCAVADGAAGNGRPDSGRRRGCLVSDSFARPGFTIEQIRTFLIVASREHITQAAKALGLSQPAVTQQVQLLERALGVPLLERLGRGVRLSEAGEEIAAACLLIMRALENLEGTARSIRGLEAGSLAIGASQVAGSFYLSRALAAFSAAHPGVAVDIEIAVSREVCDQVSAGILEFGLVDGPLPRTRLTCTAVASDEVVLTVHPGHPLADQEQISPEDLKGSSYLLWERGSGSEAMPVRLLGSAYHAMPQIQLANIEAARRMLLAEPCFIAAMPRIAIADDLGRKALATVGRRPVARPVYAVRRPGSALGPAAQAFWSVLTDSQRRASPELGVTGKSA